MHDRAIMKIPEEFKEYANGSIKAAVTNMPATIRKITIHERGGDRYAYTKGVLRLLPVSASGLFLRVRERRKEHRFGRDEAYV